MSNRRLNKIIKDFLKYSMEPIHYKYKLLTISERVICSEKEYKELTKWIKK